MGYARYNQAEEQALQEISRYDLDELIEKCRIEENISPLAHLPFNNCGPYVTKKLHEFKRALTELYAAQRGRRLRHAEDNFEKAAHNLSDAVSTMQSANKEAKKKLAYFKIGAATLKRHGLKVEITISFKWRESPKDDWTTGDITYQYVVDVSKPIGYYLNPHKKLSRQKEAEQERLRQEEIVREAITWITNAGKESLHHYLDKHHDGTAIPKVFKIEPENQFSGLTNSSTDFSPDCRG